VRCWVVCHFCYNFDRHNLLQERDGVCVCRVCVWVMDVQMLPSVDSVYGESPLERLREGRLERPPISFVRLAGHRELRQRVYRHQVFVVHGHKCGLLHHQHDLPLCASHTMTSLHMNSTDRERERERERDRLERESRV
jgi:hypothetical protein